MNHENSFAVIPYENRNGVTSWRVTGWLADVRVRKNFLSREEAAAEKATLELMAIQATAGMRSAMTFLADDKLREAEDAFRRLEGKSQPLRFYLDYALTNYREPDRQKALADAAKEYVEGKQREHAQDQLSLPMLYRIQWEMKRLVRHFPKKNVSDLTAPLLIAYLEAIHAGMKTFNNRRGVISTFLKFCFQRSWIVENPILRVPHYRIRHRRGTAKTLTAAQARELMEHFETAEGARWIPYFVLCLFAGIRPSVPHGEMTKLKPDAIHLDENLIYISSEVSKVREPRKIVIQPNVAAWLKAYPLSKYPLIVGNFKRRREKLRDRFNLTYDVLRHTFISMFVAKYRSIGEAAIQAGNSEAIIRKHYLDLKTAAEAEEFFSIFPKRTWETLPAPVPIRPVPAPALKVAV